MSNTAARSKADVPLLRGNWGNTETNRTARFYAVTAPGRRQLATERHAWDRMAGIIHTLLRGEA